MSPNQAIDQILGKPVEHVGVILVHGIGEQRRYEHLESEARRIINAIIANYGQRRRDVTVTLTTASGDAFQGNQSTWVSGFESPLHALVEFQGKIVDIAFHEVWWADINEVLTVGKQVRFWLWGLSISGIATNNETFLPGTEERTRAPNRAGKLTLWNRFRMAYIGMLFGLSTFSVAFINLILKRLDASPLLATRVIVNYLSGVKLFNQTTRAGGSPMDGPDEPPRVAIRRRTVRAMVELACRKCDRWYILAHSLGTIPAWNALMEIQEALPNYLSHEQWSRLSNTPLVAMSADPFDVTAMMPTRPVWLGRNEIIDRAALFEKFRGIITYGSPLERFCALWSSAVRINRQEFPFHKDVEWINVYDPTDPVGTWISDFDPAPQGKPPPGRTALKPRNFPCRTSVLVLYSHICYFRAPPTRPSTPPSDSKYWLVNEVADWLVRGDSLVARLDAAPKGNSTFWMPLKPGGAAPGWQTYLRARWRVFQWMLMGCALTALALLSLHYVIYPMVRAALSWFGLVMVQAPDLAGEAGCLWGGLAVVVLTASIVHYALASRDLEHLKQGYELQNRKQQPE